MRILIVDDELVSREKLRNIMDSLGQCTVVENGADALRVATSQNPPDLILLDIVMPGMDGYEVCKRLKANRSTSNIPVIFISSKSEEEDEAQGLRLGAVDYIKKPFSPSIVKVRVRTHLELKKHRNRLEELVNERTVKLKKTAKEMQVKIAERKQVEEALRESEAQKKAILDASIDVIRLVDKDMKIIWANKTTTTELNAAPEQLVGSFCYEAVAGRDTPCPGCPTRKALKSGKTEHALMHHKELKGIKEETYWDDYAVPIKNESGDIVNLIQISRNITDRKQAEEALRVSEEKYRNLVESMSDGLVIYDENNLSTYANDRFCRMLGYSKDEIMERPAIDFLDDANRKALEKQIRKRRKGKREPYELDWIRKDGQKIATIVSPSPIFDVEDRYAGAFAVVTDISEHKDIQKKLEESVSLLSATFDATADGILVVDREGKIVSFNKRFVEMWRIPDSIIETGEDDQALAFVLNQLKNPEIFLKKVKALYSQPDEKSFDVLDFEDGRTFERYSRPQRIEGKSVGRVWSFRNVTDRKQAEEALRESQKKYRTVLDSNPDPVVVYDMEGKVVYFNRTFARVFGWSLEEQIGKKIDNFVPEPNWPETRIMINRVTTLGESFSGLETRRYTKEGNVLDISISGSCYRDQEGNIAASVINLRDITEQKKLESKLQQAHKMDAIATLAGGVAHEFNNALMGIMGNIELLKMDLPEDEGRDKYFDPMKSSGHRMSRLTDQLLAYAQGGKYQAKHLKLDDFMIQTLPILQHDLSPAVRVETHFEKDIPYIKADYAQMQMVLSAILANSNEAIEDKGLIKVTAGNEDLDEDFTKQYPGLKTGPYVCLTIEDDGKGMDEETRTGIFEPFFTTKFHGRGMGMAAVYGIVKNHDGWIFVDSELGKGTTVWIYLPAISAESKEQGAKAATQPDVELGTGEGTILMIEDEDVVIEVTQAILERLGYRVMVAKTGKDAIHITETFDGQIDLALLDIKLPDMQGGKVYPIIMKARPDLKVIVFSGYSIEGPAREILDAGAQDFIQKPFSIATLSEKLKEVLKGK